MVYPQDYYYTLSYFTTIVTFRHAVIINYFIYVLFQFLLLPHGVKTVVCGVCAFKVIIIARRCESMFPHCKKILMV